MKHIILPTDFSKNAMNACKYALKLFENDRCTFHVVNCYAALESHHSIYTTALDWDAPDNNNRFSSEQRLLQFVAKVKGATYRPRHFFKTVSSARMLTNEIKDLIQETGAELVIMGTKGASGLKEIYMGTTTVHVIKSIKSCPVLAIPENFNFKEPLEIAFATDLYRFYSQSELQTIMDFANTFKSTVRIVNVTTGTKSLTDIQKFNLYTIQKHFGSIPNYLHSAYLTNSISKTLELLTEELDVHLLALLNYPHSYLEKASREPVVKKTAFHTRIPLLVIPEMSMATPSKRKKEAILAKA